MPQFPWHKSSLNRSSKSGQTPTFYVEGQQQHPDLPLPTPRTTPVGRSASVTERHGNHHQDNRRSVALFNPTTSSPAYPENSANSSPSVYNTTSTSSSDQQYFSPPRSPALPTGITRSQTVVYRQTSYRARDVEPIDEVAAAHWSPNFHSLPTPDEQREYTYSEQQESASMNGTNATGKTSSDSGSATGLDRWSQRRLQRLNTEQGFREQRQGAASGASSSLLSATPSGSAADHAFASSNYTTQQQHEAAQPQSSLHQQSQPQQATYNPATSRSGSNAGLQQHQNSTNNNSHSRSPNNYAHDPATTQHQQQYSPPDALVQYQAQHSARNAALLQQQQQPQQQQQQQQSRNYQSTTAANAAALNDADQMSVPNGNSATAVKASRSGLNNRQSVHTDLLSRDATNAQSQADARRITPQTLPTSEEMSEEDVNQLIKDHKELRDKYTKVKKYYFEKEDQVKQLQNSLAHQRLSQSRTSLDDSEYTTRFNRLDGLIAQLAFSIRKSWRSLPTWLANSVNKDAVVTGKQEMTAAGRAFISCWLVEEVFDKYFHPDLEPALSAQLKTIQRNIRRYATPAQTSEEEDYLTSKIVNWRLATLEGLQDALRSPQCPTFRAQMTDMLQEHLCGALAVHLQDPPPSDLEGGVHMIIELVVSIAIHLPLESRDVVIEYYMPSHNIAPDQMKVESGIPALTVSIADDAADRASMKSATSDFDNDSVPDQPSKKRSMLSALTGSGNKTRAVSNQQKSQAGASSSSLQRPESSAGKDETPRVRMAAGIGVAIRGRSVLVKAPVFST